MTAKIRVETQEQMEQLMEQLQLSTPQTEHVEEKRNHCRITYHTPGTVKLKDGSVNSEPINIYDITIDGLGFLSSRRFMVGQKFIINIATGNGEIEIPATGLHCTGTFGIFMIGVKFDFCDTIDNCKKAS
jgi:hypothetical protein